MSDDDNNTCGVEDTTTGDEEADDGVTIGVEDSKTPSVDVSISVAEDISGDEDDIVDGVVTGKDVVIISSKK